MIDACFIPTPVRGQREQGGLLHVAGRSPRQEEGSARGVQLPHRGVAWLGNPSSDDLRDRGLERVDLFVSDGLNNIEDAIWKGSVTFSVSLV